MFEKFAQSGLIEPEELHELINSKSDSIRILDASFSMPSSGVKTRDEFLKSHIEGAQFFNIDEIADHNTDLPHMLPTAEEFSEAVSNLGIDNESFIIIYGQDGIIMGAARAWWMFKVMGHDNVCILNGGLPAWLKAGYETTDAITKVTKSSSSFKTHPRPLVCTMRDVQKNSENNSAYIFDARPKERFFGEIDEPRKGLLKGHIPNSYNIPASSLVNLKTGKLKTVNELEAILSPFDILPEDQIITTCGSGVTACIISFALHHLGIKNSRVYDGSWTEWANPQLKNPIS